MLDGYVGTTGTAVEDARTLSVRLVSETDIRSTPTELQSSTTASCKAKSAVGQSGWGVYMAQDKKLLSLTAALAGLLATVPAQALNETAAGITTQQAPNASSVDEIPDNDFVLLPQADPDGSIYLQHRSHSSHSSHSSHRSSR